MYGDNEDIEQGPSYGASFCRRTPKAILKRVGSFQLLVRLWLRFKIAHFGFRFVMLMAAQHNLFTNTDKQQLFQACWASLHCTKP